MFRTAAARDNRSATWRGRRLSPTIVNGLIDRIETLLEEPCCTGDELALEQLESTLTDGYAEALRLDSDRIKIERQIDQVVVSPSANEVKAQELNTLILQLADTRRDLEHLRALLESLRVRAKAVRAAAA
jgi:hypothetical protein